MAHKRWPKNRCLAPSKAERAADFAFLFSVSSPCVIPGGLERVLQVGVDDLEGAGVGVVDAALLGRERVFEDIDLDPS